MRSVGGRDPKAPSMAARSRTWPAPVLGAPIAQVGSVRPLAEKACNSRPADRYHGHDQRILEQQIPTNYPRDEFANTA
jgi:hypothetical protein